jgi:hypothetical protein
MTGMTPSASAARSTEPRSARTTFSRGPGVGSSILCNDGQMQAELTRDGQLVGVLVMTRDGVVSRNFEPAERERLEPIIASIIEGLGDNRMGWFMDDPAPGTDVTPEPGGVRWFEEVLSKLKANGYDSLVMKDDPEPST